MSAEYLLKMELLRKNREDLAAKRQAIERRIALREATAAEYSAAALQNCKQKWKSLRAAAITAKSRNDEFIREIHETQRKVNEAYLRCKEGLWPSYNQLEQEKERYFRKVEVVYPAWQEKVQALRLQKLRDLEEKKRTIEKRRYLAKQSFETEQTVDDLIRQTRHEIELAENLEKNEAYERQLLRDQTSRDASQLDQTIREHAAGARLYMKQQANDHLHDPDGMDEEFKERIFETFSPRSAVQTLRETRSSVVLAEHQPVEDDQPRRQLTLTVPQSYRPSSTIDYDDSNFESEWSAPTPQDQYVADRRHDGGRRKLSHLHTASTRSECNASISHAAQVSPYGSRTGIDARPRTITELPPNLPPLAPSALSHVNADERHSKSPVQLVDQPLPVQISILSTHAVVSPPTPVVEPSTESQTSIEVKTNRHTDGIATSIPNQSIPTTSTIQAQSQLSDPGTIVPEVFSIPISIDGVRSDVPSKPIDTSFVSDTTERRRDREQIDGEPSIPQESHEIIQLLGVSTATESHEDIQSADVTETEDKSAPFIQHVTKIKEIQLPAGSVSQSTSEPNISSTDTTEVVLSSDILSASVDSLGSMASQIPAPTQPIDLSLNLVNSFDSNQSSMLDFSVGKLLETPKGDAISSKPDVVSRIQVTSESTSTVPKELSELDGQEWLSVGSFNASPDPPARPERIDSHLTSGTPKHPVVHEPTDPLNALQRGQRAEPEAPKVGVSQSLVFSSLESVSMLGSPPPVSDSLESPVAIAPVPVPESIDSPDRLQDEMTAVQYPTLDDIEESFADEILSAELSMPERLKALTALIGRVEDGIGDGDQISASVDIGSSMETKRDLLRMAVAGRKAQINFFGTDICFEVVVTIARELGAVLFPPKSFEGIMNEQKMKKVHQNAKEKEFDIWKALSAHLKQLHTLKAMPVSALVDVFVTAFLNHDPDNQRSQRKLREFLFSICGASESSPKKELNSTSSLPSAQPAKSAPSPPNETALSSQMPSLLQTAFLQHSSPPKGAKTFGIASSGPRKASSSDDILKSMASSPTRLGQKILRGGKMGDYSEFEEEDEVNLENLIGKKSMAKPASSMGNANARGGGNASRMATMREVDDFDVDF